MGAAPDWPDPWLDGIAAALLTIPGADRLDAADLTGKARRIEAAAWHGRDATLPRNRPATRAGSEGELRRLHDLAAALADHIEAMRAPSVEALTREGLAVFGLAAQLREAQDRAREAFSEIYVPEATAGRPPAAAAAEVTEEAARIWREITGRAPTFTTDPATSERRGAWPATLAAVFDALSIDAKPGPQARAQVRKRRPKTTE